MWAFLAPGVGGMPVDLMDSKGARVAEQGKSPLGKGNGRPEQELECGVTWGRLFGRADLFGLGCFELDVSVRFRNSEKRLVVSASLGVVGILLVFRAVRADEIFRGIRLYQREENQTTES